MRPRDGPVGRGSDLDFGRPIITIWRAVRSFGMPRIRLASASCAGPPNQGRARQQALGEATFVVRVEHWFRAVENDRDPERRAGEPVDWRAQGRDLLQAILVAHHDEAPRLAVLRASRPPGELQELIHDVVRHRLRLVLTDLRYPTDRLERRRTIAALGHVSAIMPQ